MRQILELIPILKILVFSQCNSFRATTQIVVYPHESVCKLVYYHGLYSQNIIIQIWLKFHFANSDATHVGQCHIKLWVKKNSHKICKIWSNFYVLFYNVHIKKKTVDTCLLGWLHFVAFLMQSQIIMVHKCFSPNGHNKGCLSTSWP